jgi:effector-binding domain-containing protein
VTYLQAYLQGEGQIMSYTVQSKGLPDMTTISRTRRVGIGDLPVYLSATIARLQNIARLQGTAAGPPIARYHGEVSGDSDGPVEVCLPISGPVDPAEDVELKDWPAVEVAYTFVTRRQGMFPEVLGAYDACYEWIRAQGRKCEGSPMEIYPNDPEEGDLDALFFEVAWAYR